MQDPEHIQTLETLPSRWTPQIPRGIAPHGTLYARVNWSRWIVDCPFCSAAQDASKSVSMFWCNECQMKQNEGAPMRVEFPEDAEMIESVLMERSDYHNRNWKLPETLQDLIAENKAHGE